MDRERGEGGDLRWLWGFGELAEVVVALWLRAPFWVQVMARSGWLGWVRRISPVMLFWGERRGWLVSKIHVLGGLVDRNADGDHEDVLFCKVDEYLRIYLYRVQRTR